MLILLGAGKSLMAQEFYVKLGGAYGMALMPENIKEESIGVYDDNLVLTTTTKNVEGSYGAGMVWSASVGYKFSPFIGIDLYAGYLQGKEYESNSSYTDGRSYLYGLQENTQAKGMLFSPSFLYMAGAGKVRPYALIGPVFGKVDVTDVQRFTYEIEGATTESVIKAETTGALGIGVHGGLGVDYAFTNHFCIFGEGTFNALNFYAEKKEYTSYTTDNEEVIDELSTYQRVTVYKESVETTGNSQEEIDYDQPNEELRSKLPLSSLSFSIGVRLLVGLGW